MTPWRKVVWAPRHVTQCFSSKETPFLAWSDPKTPLASVARAGGGLLAGKGSAPWCGRCNPMSAGGSDPHPPPRAPRESAGNPAPRSTPLRTEGFAGPVKHRQTPRPHDEPPKKVPVCWSKRRDLPVLTPVLTPAPK